MSVYKPTVANFSAYVLPAVLVFGFCTIIPITFTTVTSLFRWQVGTSLQFIGLDNWHRLITDPFFWNAFGRNLTLVAIAVLGQVGLGFALAMFFSSKAVRYAQFYRAVLFIPVVLSAIVVGFLWNIMYNRQFGLVNLFLESVGLESLVQEWLGNPRIVLYSIGVSKVWQYVGLHLMIILAGIQSISPEIFDSAAVDGAGPIRRAVSIVLPLIRNTLTVSAMISIATNMKEFDHVYAMTRGGPGQSSTVLALYAYRESIDRLNLGYGGTIAIGILLLSAMLILPLRTLVLGKREA